MARRTLRASKAGIDRAKRALKRLGLTQKDLTIDPLIASWGTINGFFNGRAIDHTFFKEICFHLDLDWKEIYEPPPDDDIPTQAVEPEPQPVPPLADSLLSAVQHHAIAAREALTPRILERIPREIVRKKYLPAIDRGVREGQQRVIPIIGAAGYGKSTILGDLYDELTQAGTPWVGLILCSTLSVSVEARSFISYSVVASTFANAAGYSPASPSSYQASMVEIGFGKSLCGMSQSIVEIVEHLNRTQGRGVLLIDTLDLVINRDFTPAFATLLRQLLEHGTTVVFTCRDHEYNDYLEPTRERLAGISQTIDRHTVPNFTTAEIRAASEAFFRILEPSASDRGKVFADNILALSADNRSLRDIIENPLLLALLCDLFAQDGNVPADLTVSKLYKRYWNEKIAYSRLDQSRFVPLAIEKENLCLTIARMLFEMSQTRLCESIYRDEIDIQFNEVITNAYSDLLSEGVLDRLPSGKVHFFHQTLLEYAIAYWLTRHSAQSQRNQWIENLRNPDSGAVNHWYPVLRQYLTIVETDDEFEQLAEQLGSHHLGIFSSIVFAAASRDRPDALLKRLPIALQSGESYQKRLQQALESAPRQLAEEVWSVMVTLLEQGSHTIAINTARTLNSLVVRWWEQLGFRLGDAMAAVAQRTGQSSTNDQAMILGWLVQDSLPLLQQHPNPTLLAALRRFYLLFGARSCMKIIQLHLEHETPDAQEELLMIMLQQAIPDHVELENTIAKFLATLMANKTIIGAGKLWDSWMAALHHVNAQGWDVVQARAVGRCAANDPEIITLVLQDLLSANPAEPRRNSIVLSEAIRQGAAAQVAHQLLQCPFGQLIPPYFSTIASFLRMQGHLFSADDQEAIAQKLKPFAAQQPERLRPAFDALADSSMTAREVFRHLVSQLPTKKQAEYEGRFLRFLPIDQHPPLETLDKQSQLFLLKLYRTEVKTSPKAVQQILQATHSKYKEVAIAASQGLYLLLGDQLRLQTVIGLLQSRFPGVRVNALMAIVDMTDRGKALKANELTEIAIALEKEDNQAVVCLWCELAANWVQTFRQVPTYVANAVGSTIPRLAQKGLLDGGSSRTLLSALKAIAQSVGTGQAIETIATVDVELLKTWVITLLTGIDLIRVINSEAEVIDLLSAIHRLDKSFIVRLVEQECPVFSERRWLRNIAPILKTIRRVDHARSPLLDRVLSSAWCTSEVEAIVLEIQGI